MAVTSDAMYSTNAGPSLIPSNIYCNYVPHYRNENQFNAMFDKTEIRKPPVFDYSSYDTAMETEDEECDYSAVSHYSINDSTILQASLQNRLQGNGRLQRYQQQAGEETDILRRRSQKRCNGDISPRSRSKKFREGSGKDHVYPGTGNTKDHGLATISYKSEALCVDHVNNNLKQSMIRDCCWPADDHNLLMNSNCKQLLSNNRCVPVENNVEYENILFETHGCSMYQFHRLQLTGNDCCEAEF